MTNSELDPRTSKPTRTRSVAAAAALVTGLAAGSMVATAPASAGAATDPASLARTGPGDIALQAGAYGTRLRGGDVPAGSGLTAFSVIGCSDQAGKTRRNSVLTADLPSLGTVSGVKTRNWTRKRGGTMHSFSRSSTAEVVLADSPLGKLSIRGVTSRSHAWHDGSRFRSDTRSSIGRIVFTPPVGEPQELDLPAPGDPIAIPGLASIKIGGSQERTSKTGASAWAVALKVKILPTGTDLYVARSRAQAFSGVKHGRFGGYSAGTEAQALGGVLTSGRNPLSLMPCQGTHGEVEGRDDVDVDLGGGLHVEAVSSEQWSKRLAKRSKAWERGSVAGVDLGDGALVIDAVVGKAKVVRKAKGGIKRSAAGTRIGSITVDGEPQELPLDEVVEIPGLVKLEPKVVERIRGGLKVVALRISLLDGTGAVIDLGVAKTFIRR
ncbi:MAG: choice-of-anchor P family protein [Nocardioides sp.]